MSVLEACLFLGRAILDELPLWQRQRMDVPGSCPVESMVVVTENQTLTVGEADESFTMMSAVKPLLLLRILELYGPDRVAEWTDCKASDHPYYSLRQLELDGGRPRNPMINSGAMLLASKLPGDSPSAQCEAFCDWLRQIVPSAMFDLDQECLAEVLRPGSDTANMDLARALQTAGAIEDADRTYEVYFRVCCIKASARQMAQLAWHLAKNATSHAVSAVLEAMRVAGLYEASEEWFEQTGLYAKSAVSGMMMAVVPGKMGLSACSPWLDHGGNPIVPQVAFMELARRNITGDDNGSP